MACFADPEGAAFGVWQPNQHRGATVVNEPGSLNFNGLHTRDLEAREGVLRRGVRLGAARHGHVGAARVRRPPRAAQPRDARADGASSAGPSASRRSSPAVNLIPDDQPDTPAHWDVTFGVDDADAIAARATELGGTVLVPPFDAPWIRGTVIRDPQGATFNANKFVPENRDMGRRPPAATAS